MCIIDRYENGRRLMTLAYAMIFTLPGIPSIYYGDEIGMQGYKLSLIHI